MFLCIFHHLQFSFANNSLIELPSFDLKVLQVSFSVKEKNPIVLDSRLHCYSCIWSKFISISSVKSGFQFKIAKCHLAFLWFFEKKIVSIIALEEEIIQICIEHSFCHSYIKKAEKKYMHVHLHLDCLLILIYDSAYSVCSLLYVERILLLFL